MAHDMPLGDSQAKPKREKIVSQKWGIGPSPRLRFPNVGLNPVYCLRLNTNIHGEPVPGNGAINWPYCNYLTFGRTHAKSSGEYLK